ncbi:hypothetical protein THAOC_00516, partial [Thalassiosira oceanica]
ATAIVQYARVEDPSHGTGRAPVRRYRGGVPPGEQAQVPDARRGMEEYGIDRTVLARDVSYRFACSGSAESDPVGRPELRKGRVEIVFQGHLSEEIAALLVGDEGCAHGGAGDEGYNLPKSAVNVSLD